MSNATDMLDDLLVSYATAVRNAMQVGDFPNEHQRELDEAERSERAAIVEYVASLRSRFADALELVKDAEAYSGSWTVEQADRFWQTFWREIRAALTVREGGAA